MTPVPAKVLAGEKWRSASSDLESKPNSEDAQKNWIVAIASLPRLSIIFALVIVDYATRDWTGG